MCQFFSGLAFRTGDLKFTEDDRHTTIIERLGLDDSADLFARGWVRFEIRPKGDGWEPVIVDETSVPGWYEDGRVEIEDRIRALAERVRGPWAEYQRVKAAARAEYQRVKAAAWAEYQRVAAAAWAEYDRVTAAARATFIATLRPIEGYVPARAA